MPLIHPITGLPLPDPPNQGAFQLQDRFQQPAQPQAAFPSPALGIAQQFINGAREYQAQQAAAPPPINARGFIGLTPQMAQAQLTQRQNQQALQQQAAADQQRQQLEEQKLTMSQMEEEKNRALKIKLTHQQIKNARAIAKAKADAQAHTDELTKAGQKATQDYRDQLLQLQKNKPIVIPAGSALADPSGNELAYNPREFAPQGSAGTPKNTSHDVVEQDANGKWHSVHYTFDPSGIVLTRTPSDNTVAAPSTAIPPEDRAVQSRRQRAADAAKAQAAENNKTYKPGEDGYRSYGSFYKDNLQELEQIEGAGSPATAQSQGGSAQPTPADVAQIGEINRSGGNATWDPDRGEIIIRGN